MRIFAYAMGVSAILLSSCFSPVLAQDTDMGDNDFEALPRRKRASLFRRPQKDTPEAQLRHAERLLNEGEVRKAMKQYLALVHNWHQSPEAATAQRRYADLLDQRGKYLRAFNEYQYLIDNYTGQFAHEEVLDLQFRIANHLMSERKMKFLFFPGITAPEKALPLFEDIVENAPFWKKAPEAQFYIGMIHEEGKDYAPAVKAYATVQQRYPKSPFAAAASFSRARCLRAMVRAAPRDERTCREAISALFGFLREHPGDPNTEQAQEYLQELKKKLEHMYYDRAVFYDRVAKRPRAAVITYSDFLRQFPASEMSGRARHRMETLQKELGESE